MSKSIPVESQIKVSNLGQFVKHLNFEVITSPYELLKVNDVNPQIQFKLGTKKQNLGDHNYEVSLKVEASSKSKSGDEIFNVDLEYSGVFKIEGDPSAEIIEEILLVNCVTLIFPFARQKIADVTMSGGYQPLMMDPIDFRQIYLQSKRENKSEVTDDTETINTMAV